MEFIASWIMHIWSWLRQLGALPYMYVAIAVFGSFRLFIAPLLRSNVASSVASSILTKRKDDK